MTPNPRQLSRTFLARGGEMKEVPFLNLLAASWINFQNHDWIHHGELLRNEVHEVPLAEDDPARREGTATFHTEPADRLEAALLRQSMTRATAARSSPTSRS